MTPIFATVIAIVLLAEIPAMLEKYLSDDAAQRSPLRLDSRIPPANPAKYRDIREGSDWRNPRVTILPNAVQVFSEALEGGSRTVAVNELGRVLVSLPVSAWPYGRVVMVSEIGIRSPDRRDDAAILANRDPVKAILRRLRIEADWWPS